MASERGRQAPAGHDGGGRLPEAMRPRHRVEDIVYRVPEVLAALCLFVMMLLVATDVAGRYLFNHPIGGGYELVQALMGVLVFAGLPVVSRANEHIGIGLLDAMFKGGADRVRVLFVNSFSAAALGFVAWRLGEHSVKLVRNGDVTAVLALPLAPIGFFMTAMTAAAAGALLVLSWRVAMRWPRL